MCSFCAAIPMSASVGTVLARKQHQRNVEAQMNEAETPSRNEPPLRTITIAVTGGLILGSAVYHLVIMPRTGAIF